MYQLITRIDQYESEDQKLQRSVNNCDLRFGFILFIKKPKQDQLT